jgi:hypothetical protein
VSAQAENASDAVQASGNHRAEAGP